ncbi:hypothetical protein OSCT_0254 [Oscillochloris trichoides DG-6]|uniref:Uncharacterized protein n=1 Tax=Oscillochloris trichoides DG-6 TaxID=765420 RepID=E1IAA3_9CHLR|nr:hypothetical protein [Oscillochloris trichoides]EFO81857.1 hypothetical protein OSCT_0254 [Oscillochloris trichoides DG-6]
MAHGLLTPHPRTEVRTTLENAYIAELMAGGQPTTRVVNVYSFTGMGKTWLGYMMFAQTPLPPEAMALWISFEHTDEKPLPEIPDSDSVSIPNNELLTQLAHQPFAERINCSALNEIARLFGERFKLQYRLGTRPKKDGPLLIFFDALNELSRRDLEPSDRIGSSWEYAETQIIEPAARQKNTVIFCFSHAPIQWNFYYLREVDTKYNLDPMSEDEVKELLDKQHISEPIYPFVYRISMGHPWTISYILLDDPGFLVDPNYESDISHKISQLPAPYRDLLYIVGILRVVEVAPIEALLEGLNITEIQGRPVNRGFIRAALGSFKEFFEPSSNRHRTRFAAKFRRVIEKEIPDERLIERLGIILKHYNQYVYSSYLINERYSALREYFYTQIKIIITSMSQCQDINLHQSVNEMINSMIYDLRKTIDYFNEKFISDVAGEVLYDPEIKFMLASLGLAVNNDGQIINDEYIEANLQNYSYEVANTFIPRIIEPYGLRMEDIEPLAWIAKYRQAAPITLDLLREAYQALRRPEPKSSLLRYHLSRYTAANIVRYNYNYNNYTLNDWLRDLLANYEEQLHDTREIIQ